MKKQFYKISILSFILLVFISISSVVYSMGNNLPITLLPVHQSKSGGVAVNKLAVWDKSSSKLIRVSSSGYLGVGLPLTGETNPTAPLDVRGLIRLSDLKESGRQVCANKDGDITACGFVEFEYGKNCVGSCGTQTTTHKFTVPEGVSKINVELYGAGGMGYFYGSNSSNKSPDNYSSCLTNGFWCADGGSSYFYDTNGSSLIARAFGGKAPISPDGGGDGGSTYVDTSNTDLSNTLEINGAEGGDGESASNSYVNSINCDNANYYDVTIGGTGGEGGMGGNSGPNSGALVVGGMGGRPGIASDCNLDTIDTEGRGFYGENGNQGISGAGGSGAGGYGGSSQYLFYDSSANYNTSSLKGFSGGGGGGYVSFDLDVTPQEVYTIKLSHGGRVNIPVFNQAVSGIYGCDEQVKWTCYINVYSGSGGNGFARISY